VDSHEEIFQTFTALHIALAKRGTSNDALPIISLQKMFANSIRKKLHLIFVLIDLSLGFSGTERFFKPLFLSSLCEQTVHVRMVIRLWGLSPSIVKEQWLFTQ
jgi:hypothetical protein